jgi:hypothetical protein
MDKKQVEFDVADILPIGLTFIVLGIGLAYGLSVMGSVRTGMTTNSAEYNATTQAITGVAVFPSKLSLIATVIVAAIIIGILVRYLMVRM